MPVRAKRIASVMVDGSPDKVQHHSMDDKGWIHAVFPMAEFHASFMPAFFRLVAKVDLDGRFVGRRLVYEIFLSGEGIITQCHLFVVPPGVSFPHVFPCIERK
jgi:hypothetical protein